MNIIILHPCVLGLAKMAFLCLKCMHVSKHAVPSMVFRITSDAHLVTKYPLHKTKYLFVAGSLSLTSILRSTSELMQCELYSSAIQTNVSGGKLHCIQEARFEYGHYSAL